MSSFASPSCCRSPCCCSRELSPRNAGLVRELNQHAFEHGYLNKRAIDPELLVLDINGHVYLPGRTMKDAKAKSSKASTRPGRRLEDGPEQIALEPSTLKFKSRAQTYERPRAEERFKERPTR